MSTCPHLSCMRESFSKHKNELNYLEKQFIEHLLNRKSSGDTFDYTYACAHCNFVGTTVVPDRSLQHHMLRSNHFLAICLDHNHFWCARCGDVVFDRLFEQALTKAKAKQETKCSLELIIQKDATLSKKRSSIDRRIPCVSENWFVSVAEQRVPAFAPFDCDATDGAVETAIHGLRGICNMGNTCFMNSVLQAMAHIPLMQGFVLGRNIEHPHEGDNQATCIFCEALATLTAMFSPPKSASKTLGAIAPCPLLHTIWLRCPHLAGHEQRDAHEFMVALLQGLSHDLQREGESRKRPRQEVTTPIEFIFSGELCSTLTCGHCGRKSKKMEPFVDLSLCLTDHSVTHKRDSKKQVKRRGRGGAEKKSFGVCVSGHGLFSFKAQLVVVCDNCGNTCAGGRTLYGCRVCNFDICQACLSTHNAQMEGSTENSKDNENVETIAAAEVEEAILEEAAVAPLNLEDCLDRFTASEQLLDKFECEGCFGERRPATKQLTVSKLPNTLVIHLKRFGVSSVRDAKLVQPVQFPLQGLDLGSHLTGWRETGLCESKTDPPSMLYDLCGVVNHVGTLSKGHYFAHVLEGGRWWLCDDGKPPRLIEPQDVTENSETGNPYLLFYTRRKYSSLKAFVSEG